MFVGYEGLFGIALEITLRLLPVAEAFTPSLAGYDTLDAAGDAVAEIVAAGLLPGAMEIMDALAIEAAEAAVKPNYPQGGGAADRRARGRARGVDADARGSIELLRGLGRERRRARPRTPRSGRDLEGPQERVQRGRPARRPTTSSRTASCRARGSARRWRESAKWRATRASASRMSFTPATATCIR